MAKAKKRAMKRAVKRAVKARTPARAKAKATAKPKKRARKMVTAIAPTVDAETAERRRVEEQTAKRMEQRKRRAEVLAAEAE